MTHGQIAALYAGRIRPLQSPLMACQTFLAESWHRLSGGPGRRKRRLLGLVSTCFLVPSAPSSYGGHEAKGPPRQPQKWARQKARPRPDRYVMHATRLGNEVMPKWANTSERLVSQHNKGISGCSALPKSIINLCEMRRRYPSVGQPWCSFLKENQIRLPASQRPTRLKPINLQGPPPAWKRTQWPCLRKGKAINVSYQTQ